MRFGLRLHDTIPGTLEERLAFAGKQGFDCAHLALSKVLPGFSMADSPTRLADPAFEEEIKGAFQRTGMDCVLLGCYLNLTHPDTEEREKTREIYYAHLAFGRKIGAWMVGTETPAHPASPLAKDAAHSEEAFRFFLDQVRPVVRRAEEEGETFVIEPVYSHIVSTPERAERALDTLKSDSVRVILDAVNLLGPGNLNRRDQVIQEAISRLGDRVALMHMKDYRMEGDKMVSVACGTGNMDYRNLMAFAETRDMTMTLENTHPENAEEARAALLRAAGR